MKLIFLIIISSLLCSEAKSQNNCTFDAKEYNNIITSKVNVKLKLPRDQNNLFITNYEAFKSYSTVDTTSIDFNKYNLFFGIFGSGGCKRPRVNYWLLKAKKDNALFLKVDKMQIGRCKVGRIIRVSFIVLKDSCPYEPVVCTTNQILDDKK